jgi:hypothetical protein
MTGNGMLSTVSSELRVGNKRDTQILDWLETAVTSLGDMYEFSSLNRYAAKPTTGGVPDIQLADDFHWAKSFRIPVRRIVLTPIDELALSHDAPDYRTRTGTINWYYLNGKTLGLYLVPTGIDTIEYQYQKYPDPIVATDVEYTDIPAEWHNYLAQVALTAGYALDRNITAQQSSQAAEKSILRTLGASKYRRPDVNNVFSGPDDLRSSRLARPRIPRNIPIP